MKRFCLNFILAGALSALTGCGAVVLSSRAQYQEEVTQLRAEMVAGTRDAYTAGMQHDEKGYLAGLDRTLNACGKIDRLVSYGEQAIRSFYAQRSSVSALSALERAAWEKDCKVDGLDRLHEETVALTDTAEVLRGACGCDFNGPENNIDIDTYVAYGKCSLTQGAWNDFWNDANRDVLVPIGTGLLGIATAGLAPLFITGGLLGGLSINAVDRKDYCEGLHANYTTQYKKIAALRKRCTAPPPPPEYGGARSAEQLDEQIQDTLLAAREGIAADYDGSSLYAAAYDAQAQCAELVNSMGDLRGGSRLVDSADIDTKPDQDVSAVGDYQIPEIPEPPYTPPGG